MDPISARLLALYTRVELQPEGISATLDAPGAPVCYVFETRSGVDLEVLNAVTRRAHLPRISRHLPGELLRGMRARFALQRPAGIRRNRLDRRVPRELNLLLAQLAADPAFDVRLVPATVFWGRAPQKERSWFRLLFSDDWVRGSRLGRFFMVLVNGRNVLLQLDPPQSLRALTGGAADSATAARRVARALRQQFARTRAARIGPDLSHRRTIVAQVLRTRAVRAAVAQEVRDRGRMSRREALLEARKCAEEIAANYSHSFVRMMAALFTRVWDRLYDGVELAHAETLGEVADGNEIIYVPCHRSHMDYLLLSHAIYQRGYAIPHIAAGINLNLPMIGPLLRKGGAFFIRRSFRGSGLYTVVFMQYLSAIMARGHSIEYFIEGGRSRTGRLLAPMTGMLSMTLRSYLRAPRRPLVFLPVYFGYERIWEGRTYIGELSGKAKEKESLWGLLRNLARLRERFGRVHVNLGEPIPLAALLERAAPGWNQQPYDDQNRPPWLGAAVDTLADRIMRNINAAAALTPVNLLALALLATPRQTLLKGDLLRQLGLLLALNRAAPYSDRVTCSTLEPEAMLAYGIELQLVETESTPSGEYVRMTQENAVLATYYRNNVAHLYALPSLIACAFISNPALGTSDIERLASRIYPYVAAELFLRWPESELPAVLRTQLAALAAVGLLTHDPARDLWRRPEPNTAAAMQLSLLAQGTVQTIERYYLAIALLVRAGSNEIGQSALEQNCQLMAERMTRLHGLNSPEFFDRRLFENFLDLLRARGVLRVDDQGRLEFDDVLRRVADDAQLVLSEQIRHSILQVTHS